MLLVKYFAAVLMMSCVLGYKRHHHNRIVGGKKAPLGKFPFIVSLRNEDFHICSATIISKRWLLTAGHCVCWTKNKYSVVAGTVTLDKGGDTYEISKVICHDRYNPWVGLFDMALLRTRDEIQFNDNVAPIAFYDERVEGGLDVVVCGWGSTFSPEPPEKPKAANELHFIKLKTITNDECNKLAPPAIAIANPIRINQLCTFTNKKEGTCFGDSGGALVTADHNELVGIVSRGMSPGRCAQDLPDIYSRMISFKNWVIAFAKDD